MSRVARRPLAAADIVDIRDHIAEDSVDQDASIDVGRVLHTARNIDAISEGE